MYIMRNLKLFLSLLLALTLLYVGPAWPENTIGPTSQILCNNSSHSTKHHKHGSICLQCRSCSNASSAWNYSLCKSKRCNDRCHNLVFTILRELAMIKCRYILIVGFVLSTTLVLAQPLGPTTLTGNEAWSCSINGPGGPSEFCSSSAMKSYVGPNVLSIA